MLKNNMIKYEARHIWYRFYMFYLFIFIWEGFLRPSLGYARAFHVQNISFLRTRLGPRRQRCRLARKTAGFGGINRGWDSRRSDGEEGRAEKHRCRASISPRTWVWMGSTPPPSSPRPLRLSPSSSANPKPSVPLFYTPLSPSYSIPYLRIVLWFFLVLMHLSCSDTKHDILLEIVSKIFRFSHDVLLLMSPSVYVLV